ncbi:hypothetical protein ACJDU8_12830 [Clostridium sp. WILCCON 0269]|uniref:Uncharacterized protein n=1 Tax=Candidatus Clostridium eludens TaxID=3381663 RepID=A0ABW8SMM0_9CLOT
MESKSKKAVPKVQVQEQLEIEKQTNMNERFVDNFKKEYERLNTMPRDMSKIVIY